MNDSAIAIKDDLYDSVIKLTLNTVAPSSARTYRQTFTLWQKWAGENGITPSDLRPDNVLTFLSSQHVTKRTLQRYLSAMRTAARVMALDYTRPEYKSIYEALRLIKVPTDNIKKNERRRRALNAKEVWTILNAWNGDDLRSLRNYALLATLFYTGVRRSELVGFRWDDIDFSAGVIIVRHGKGDKYREVAIVGDTAIRGLQRWQEAQGTVIDQCEWVFTPITKEERITDKPIIPRAVNHIIKETEKLSGIEFATHDTRRTLGTDLLAKGYSTADVQAQLGHAHASTTIQGYGIGADARKRRAKFDTSY